RPARRSRALPAVRRQEALLGLRHVDYRIEERAGAVEHVAETAVMRLREIALERRPLDRVDRQHRGNQRLLTQRIVVAAEDEAALVLDARLHRVRFARERSDATFGPAQV